MKNTVKTQVIELESITAQFINARRAEGISKATVAMYRHELKTFAAFCQGKGVTTLDGITPDTIRGYLLELESKGRNEGGRHAAYRVIRVFLFWWEAETDNEYKAPIRKVKPPRLPDEPQDPIERGDVDQLIETCEKDFCGLRDGAIIRVLLDTGVRASELCNLDLSDLDFTDSSLLVRRGKGKKTRTVFFGKQTRRALRKWLGQRGDDKGALFCTQAGERLAYWGLREIIRRRSKAAGIDTPGLHDFRRAFTLSQLQAGVDLVTISRLLGHADVTLVARYAKQKPSDLAEKYKSPVDGG